MTQKSSIKSKSESSGLLLTEKKIPVTFVLVIGGHTFEAMALVDKLSPYIEPSYIVCSDNLLAEKKIRVSGPVYKITPSYQGVAAKNLWVRCIDMFRFFRALYQSYKILRKNGSKAIISCGSGSSLPPLIVGKLLGKKVIYVESACRVHTRSMCGKFVHKFLADLFLVQWEEQMKLYPKAKYSGRPF